MGVPTVLIQLFNAESDPENTQTQLLIDPMRMLPNPVLLILRDKASASFDLPETHQALMEIYGNGRPLQIHFA